MDSNARKKISVNDLINDNPLSGFQISVIAMCAFVAMLDGFDTQSIAFVAPSIIQEWGVDSASFGPVFSAALVGLALGAFGLGGLADHFGRKNLIIGSTIVFGSCSLATAFADSLNQIMLLRFLTGLGLGGAMPNIIALTSEYSPKRLKTLMVVIMFSGFPLGGLIGGLISTQLIAYLGWAWVFIFGGVIPLLLVPVLIWRLPESILFLVNRGAQEDLASAASHLRHISPESSINSETQLILPEEKRSGKPSVAQLFAESRTVGTLMLWLIFFTNLLMFYFLISWLPTVLASAGLPVHLAIITALLLNAGSIFGGVLLGRLVDNRGAFKVLPINYVLAALFAMLIGAFSEHLIILAALVFFAGFCVGGGQLVANSLSATFYPTDLRSTGVGWSLGFGRLGAISGPILGGILVGMDLTTQQLFAACAVPGLFAAGAVFLMGRH